MVKALRAIYCQGFETKVWSWSWSIFSLKTLRLNFGKFFEVEVWSRLWGRCLVEILMLRYGWDFEAEFWSTCDMTWRRYFNERTQPLGPSCLFDRTITPPHSGPENLKKSRPKKLVKSISWKKLFDQISFFTISKMQFHEKKWFIWYHEFFAWTF